MLSVAPKYSRFGRERGATMVESAISITFVVTMLITSVDILNLFRYSAAAFSIAVTAARFGAVEAPHADVPPNGDADLKIGPPGHPEYLAHWREYEASHTLSGPGGMTIPTPYFTEDILKSLNLGLGWAKVVLGVKFKTVSNWTDQFQVYSASPEKNEFWLVPLHYLSVSNLYSMGFNVVDPNGNKVTQNGPAEYECCVTVGSILLPTKTICRHASAARYAL